MITLDSVRTLLAEADNYTLTITLEVNPALPENQAVNPAWRIWLKNALKDVEAGLDADQAEAWRAIRPRLDAFFSDYTPQSRGLALYLGRSLERLYELSVAFENRAILGAPVVAPLLWAVDEYEPYLIVQVDQEKAQFLTAYLGGAGTEETITLELSSDDWRQYTMAPSAAPMMTGGGTIQGSHRDRFMDRVDEQIERFHRQVASQAQELARKNNAQRIILAGSEEAAHAVRRLMPEAMAQAVIAILPIPLRATPHEVLAQALPVALDYERRHEAKLVDHVIGLAKSGGRGALGRDSVLAALDQQRVEVLFVPWPLADRDLRARLSVQAFEAGSDIEMVRGEAADKLEAAGGLAARLYYAV